MNSSSNFQLTDSRIFLKAEKQNFFLHLFLHPHVPYVLPKFLFIFMVQKKEMNVKLPNSVVIGALPVVSEI